MSTRPPKRGISKHNRHRAMKVPEGLLKGILDKHIESIKFRTPVPKADSYGLIQVMPAEFKTGLGPCGRHVVELNYRITSDYLTITQKSREPDDLECPGFDEARELLQKIRVHCDAEHLRRMEIASHPQMVLTEGMFWWTKTNVIPREAIKTMFDKDILPPAQLEAIKARADELDQGRLDWEDRLEVKTFVYKMSDVLGRIEIVE